VFCNADGRNSPGALFPRWLACRSSCGAIVLKGNAAHADGPACHDDTQHNACLWINETWPGSGFYELHIGIDVYMNPALARDILARGGRSGRCDLMAGQRCSRSTGTGGLGTTRSSTFAVRSLLSRTRRQSGMAGLAVVRLGVTHADQTTGYVVEPVDTDRLAAARPRAALGQAEWSPEQRRG
jgi:hypothetical protein